MTHSPACLCRRTFELIYNNNNNYLNTTTLPCDAYFTLLNCCSSEEKRTTLPMHIGATRKLGLNSRFECASPATGPKATGPAVHATLLVAVSLYTREATRYRCGTHHNPISCRLGANQSLTCLSSHSSVTHLSPLQDGMEGEEECNHSHDTL